MKMFILGAICFYIVTSLIGFILDELKILDNWSFGEIYTQLIPSIILVPLNCICNIYRYKDFYKLMFKYGMFFKKYENLRKLTTEQLEAIQKASHGLAVCLFINQIIRERNAKTYSE